MGVLIFDERLKADIRRVRAYAERNKHWYNPDVASQKPPGDNKKHTLKTGTHRVVFSWTRKDLQVFRHMSISTGRVAGKFPQPVSAFTMAHLLGFTGADVDEHGLVMTPGPKWQTMPRPKENCIVVIQEIDG